jgi:sugar-specific transcriptional regulator TrmB
MGSPWIESMIRRRSRVRRIETTTRGDYPGRMDVDGAAERLVELGLTGYEATAYLALTRRGAATGAELARLAGLPRQRIYDVLEALVERGLASARPGRPVRYTAAAPESLLALVARRRAELDRLARDVDGVVERLGPVYRAGRAANDPLDFIEVLRDPGAIARRFAVVEASVEREILVFTKPPYAIEPGENVAGLELLKRGVEARSVYERSIYDDPAQADAVHRFVAAGEQARVVERLPLKLVLVDGRVAMFTMEDPVATDPALTIAVVEHAGFAALLRLAFEQAWSSGEPFR